MKSILYDVQLLATLTLSAKCPTLNCDSSVRFGRANFADRSENFRTEVLICVIMKLFLWLLQIAAEMVRNLVMASWLTYTVSRSWLGIFHMVGVVSYNMFAMVVACKKEDGGEIIIDQRNVDIGKGADAVVQTENAYGVINKDSKR